MGMGHAPAHAWTISLDGLRRICPSEAAACEKVFDEHGYDWDSFALALDKDDFEDVDDPEVLAGHWEALQAAFKIATTVGQSALELGIGHYSAEDGDRYDNLEEGAYFTVEGVTMLTPAGEKFREDLQEESWTVFG
jgi:hypothetical protein